MNITHHIILFLHAAEMVRICKVMGCNVREGQGKQLFLFPKDERRSIWVSRTGRRFWQPGISSCICEFQDHFDASQWETVRVDGSRMLRHRAIPLLPENNENVSLTMHNHGYAVSTSRRHPFRDITTQVNCLAHDNNYASVLSESSTSTQAAKSQVIPRTSDIAVESVPHQNVSQDLSSTSCSSHDLSVVDSAKENERSSASYVLNCSSNDHDPLSILANICASSEPVHISLSTASSVSAMRELQVQLKKKRTNRSLTT
ncbi:hypothetical protein DMN91_005005 [Ooceraea biroi]|uniref:THAP-type domain-containing protein n=1 Tax=Ooceraea biroi TaxID=2015173 RepID=A0A3L8DQN2_OOCBI|nr:hypothetical protein DMN91_005005 [Ooceraea biroi]